MTDYFAVFEEPRRPWLDPEPLKAKYLAWSAQCHPDRSHGRGQIEREAAQARYLELNAAYQCLREPRDRMRHLLELELGAIPGDNQRVPGDVSELFMEIGPVSRQADELRKQAAAITSPMLKVEIFKRALLCRNKVEELLRELDRQTDRTLQDLRNLDADWSVNIHAEAGRVLLLKRLEELFQRCSYFDRWRKQLREELFQLSS